MSAANGSDGSSQPQSPISQVSHVQLESSPISGSPQPESINNSEPEPIGIDDGDEIEIDDDDEGVVVAGSKRKLTSTVWKEFTKVEIGGTVRAKCNYCSKKLSRVSRNGTNHLRLHLKSCVQKKIKLNGKTMVQSSLRFGRTDAGTVSVENYTFDQDIARQELSAMIVLHEYPLSMVDHVGFQRFVGALQPLFKISKIGFGTNTKLMRRTSKLLLPFGSASKKYKRGCRNLPFESIRPPSPSLSFISLLPAAIPSQKCKCNMYLLLIVMLLCYCVLWASGWYYNYCYG